MPKLDDYDDSQAPVSASAKSSITNKVTGVTPAAGFGTSSPGFGAVPPASGFGSSSGFGGSSGGSGGFGGSSGGFGGSNTQSNNSANSGAMQEGGTTTIEVSGGFGDFINSKWRPMMAVLYMVTCATDFIIFPVLWSVLQSIQGGQVTSQWLPLTLQGAGLYHIAMGAVLGLAAYGRSQEKIAGKA